ncbi:hypothetical protein BDU57DRAFT_519714 [Ampelomyces quisqualis]|uniref:Lytic polysaccharide monooxygenase n=1 Tax=Ampelomyces quisqualis TaxID=50730 RepID=A0A6A5QIF8_AMPQU|nr:hypothetical protein BDU57DRAFT_519714 [Ampelomyces quisqualis]
MYTKSLSLLALVSAAQAHMSLFSPAPLGGDASINKQSTVVDPEFNFPLGCCGADGGPSRPSPGICRGHLDRFDVEEASVTWQAGQDAQFQLTNHNYDPNAAGGTHSGGSCQVGFSTDKGATWKVAASYHGACPYHTEDGSPEAQTFDFKVPTGMPEGDALFAWVWLNREHESYMNCAKVHIGSGSGLSPPNPALPSQPMDAQPIPPPTDAQPIPPPADAQPTPPPTGAEPIPPQVSTPKESTGYGNTNGFDSTSGNTPLVAALAHREVKQGVRRYTVDGHSCECRREPSNSRCFCEASGSMAEERAAIEKKALRMHRRTLYKRVDACDWASAPAMEVSYFTSDAKCAPNAKMLTPQSDNFELGWDVSCGVVQGDGQYEIKMMDCHMYGA